MMFARCDKARDTLPREEGRTDRHPPGEASKQVTRLDADKDGFVDRDELITNSKPKR